MRGFVMYNGGGSMTETQTDSSARPELQNCPGNDRLLALVSGALSSESLDGLAAHYLQCPRCRSFVEEFENDPENAVSWLLEADFGSSDVRFADEPELQYALSRSRAAGQSACDQNRLVQVGTGHAGKEDRLDRIGDYRLLGLIAQGGMGDCLQGGTHSTR